MYGNDSEKGIIMDEQERTKVRKTNRTKMTEANFHRSLVHPLLFPLR